MDKFKPNILSRTVEVVVKGNWKEIQNISEIVMHHGIVKNTTAINQQLLKFNNWLWSEK